MKHIIDKSFSFCYGHRVHNQRLDTKFTESGNACLACRHLHGHEGLVKVFLEADFNASAGEVSNVEKTGMVTDFKHLGWFKNFLDDTLDHKFIMDLKDPLFKNEFPFVLLSDIGKIKMPNNFWVPNLAEIENRINELDIELDSPEGKAIFEKYEGAIFVNFVPTSENLAGWLLSIVQEKMKVLSGVRVKAVEYWETPKSHCRVES
jgi:6-pyruvoyltetrahydropterin/6-carboxytetrahydropterin synthase